MSAEPAQPHDTGAQASETPGAPSEEELRAAYEAELSRITSADVILQAAVSLLNIGGRRLGLAGAPEGSREQASGAERDLEQVRDAIDGVRALLPLLERRFPQEVRQLRDALAQLQLAYAREAQGGTSAATPTEAQAGSPGGQEPTPAEDRQPGAERPGPGPAESSGRLWVPGR
jgi:hypothetical protein